MSTQPLLTCLVACCLLAVPAIPAAVRAERAPGGENHPCLASDPAGVLHLISIIGDPDACDIHYRRRTADGTWSAPIRVNSQAGSCVVTGTVRGPSIAIGRNGIVHVAWMGSQQAQPQAPGGHTPMLYARLLPESDTFTEQRNLIDRAHGLDGGGSVAADRSGNVWVAWHGKGDGEGETKRRVYFVHSRDDGGNFGKEQIANREPTGACACCGISAGAHDGTLAILYRIAADGGGTRDLHLLLCPQPGKPMRGGSISPWKINGCPMSTSSIDADGGALAWQQKDQVYVAALDLQRGKLGTPMPAPGQGRARKHPAVARNADGVTCFAWTEGTAWKQGGSVHWVLIDAEGAVIAESSGMADGMPAWSRPAVAAQGDDFLILY